MLASKIALLVIDGTELCGIKEDCPAKDVNCRTCLTNKILFECQNEIKDFFKEYENTEFRKTLIHGLLGRFSYLDVKGG